MLSVAGILVMKKIVSRRTKQRQRLHRYVLHAMGRNSPEKASLIQHHETDQQGIGKEDSMQFSS